LASPDALAAIFVESNAIVPARPNPARAQSPKICANKASIRSWWRSMNRAIVE
jgi:hypothetical protein